PLAALVAVLAGPWLAAPSPRWARLLAAGAVLQAVLVASSLLPLQPPYAIPHLLGQVSREQYVARTFTTTDEVRAWMNARLAPSAGVWLTGEDRRFG
ncbi:MAG: hypothetical protein AAB368_16710, partial [bacterium]